MIMFPSFPPQLISQFRSVGSLEVERGKHAMQSAITDALKRRNNK